jgi:hypothetical protein
VSLHFVPRHFIPAHFVPVTLSHSPFVPSHFVPRSLCPRSLCPPVTLSPVPLFITPLTFLFRLSSFPCGRPWHMADYKKACASNIVTLNGVFYATFYNNTLLHFVPGHFVPGHFVLVTWSRSLCPPVSFLPDHFVPGHFIPSHFVYRSLCLPVT